MSGESVARPALGVSGGLGLALLAVVVYRLDAPVWLRWFVAGALVLAAVLLLVGTLRGRRSGGGG